MLDFDIFIAAALLTAGVVAGMIYHEVRVAKSKARQQIRRRLGI